MSDLSLFLGRFHPLVVHFPIALLLLAGLLQAVLLRRRSRAADPAALSSLESIAGLVLWLGAGGAVVSAIAGLLLASSGTYGGPIYDRHMFVGLAVAATAVVAALMQAVLRSSHAGGRWMRAQMAVLWASVTLVLIAGHLGATLTHGEGFLTEHAPAFVRDWLGSSSRATAAASVSPETLQVYETFVAPALDAHCVTCHGPAKVEGGLRLDSHAALMKGGDDGAILNAGRAAASEIVRRIYLPPSHDDAMPPKGHRPLTPADAQLLAWWIDQGARADLTLGDAEIAEAVLPAIEAVTGPLDRGGPHIPSATVAAASTPAVDAVRAAGFDVSTVAAGTPFLHVHATNAAARIDDTAVAALKGIAPQILWLDLGGTAITDAALAVVAELPNLTRLHLNRTSIGDAAQTDVARLRELEYLNLYGTKITDAGLAKLKALESLRSLYVWQTGVTDAGIAELTAALPRVTVETGAETSERLP